MRAILGKFYKDKKLAQAVLKRGEVIIQQVNSFIIISEKQAEELFVGEMFK